MTFKIYSTISEKWEPKERLYGITELVIQCKQNLDCRKALYDALERIDFLSSQPTEFLECNRETIINGQL